VVVFGQASVGVALAHTQPYPTHLCRRVLLRWRAVGKQRVLGHGRLHLLQEALRVLCVCVCVLGEAAAESVNTRRLRETAPAPHTCTAALSVSAFGGRCLKSFMNLCMCGTHTQHTRTAR
jgi:hypothetical protein